MGDDSLDQNLAGFVSKKHSVTQIGDIAYARAHGGFVDILPLSVA
jgi:hypothetical protein